MNGQNGNVCHENKLPTHQVYSVINNFQQFHNKNNHVYPGVRIPTKDNRSK